MTPPTILETIIKDFTKISLRYKKAKIKALQFLFLILWCDTTIIYVLLKKANLFYLNPTAEIVITLSLLITYVIIITYGIKLDFIKETNFLKKYQKIVLKNKINVLHQALIIRAQKNNLNDVTDINPYNLLKNIFIFFSGFYFSNLIPQENFTIDNLIVISFFTFFIVHSSTLIIKMVKILTDKNNLKYKCLLEEIEEYKLKEPKNTNSSLLSEIIKIINKII